MAENKKPDFEAGKSGDIAPDDPFAELARLIAPEAEPPRQDAGPHSAETRSYVTDDDLADELLRGFDHHDPQFPEQTQRDQPISPAEPEAPEDFMSWPSDDPDYADEPQWAVEQPERAPLGSDHLGSDHFGQESADHAFSDDFLTDELERSMQSLDDTRSDSTHFNTGPDQPYYTDFQLPPAMPGTPVHDEVLPAEEPERVPEPQETYAGTGFTFEEPVGDWQVETENSETPLTGAYRQPEQPEWADEAGDRAGADSAFDDRVSETEEVAAEVPLPELDETPFNLDLDELELELSDIEPGVPAREPLQDVADSRSEGNDFFDPTELVSTAEPPAPVDDMDLPRDAADESETASYQPEPYEFDLDEELASAMAAHGPVDPLSEGQAREPEPEAQPDHAYDLANDRRYDDDIEAALSEELGPLTAPASVRHGFDDYHDEDDYEREKRPGWLAVTFMGYGRVIAAGCIIVGLAVLLIFAGLRYFSVEGDGEPMIIAADNSDVKEAPEDPGGEVVPNQDNAVFNNVEGTLSARPSQDNLIASDQEPADVENTAPNPLASAAVTQNDDQTSINSGIEPRKVRTIIVKPDGTLVERESGSATGATVSQASPTGQNGAGTVSSGTSSLETVTALPDENGNLVFTNPQTAGSGGAVQTNGENGPVEGEETSQTAEDAPGTPFDTSGLSFDPYAVPLPQRAPTDRASQASSSVAATAPAPAVGQATAPSSSSAATQSASQYSMQIASLPSEQEARQAYQRLASQHPAVLGRQGVNYVAADVNGSMYYRVRIPAASLNDAISLCERYRAEGGSCFVPR